MKKDQIFQLAAGLTLVMFGAIGAVGNIFLSGDFWRMWPIVIVLGGLALTLSGFFGLARRGLGSLFIPGLPLLITGSILLFASLTDYWNIWAIAWPMEILALALGFALAAGIMRSPGLAIPAFILGMNGLLLAFCTLTGLWEAWAVMWPIEPLSVGLGLLVLGIVNRSAGAKLAATILFSIAGFGFFIMAFVNVFEDSVLRFVGPGMLMLTGLLLAGTFFLRQQPAITGQSTSAE